jgi:hypothetical protein
MERTGDRMKKSKQKLDKVMSLFGSCNHGYSPEDAAMMLQRYKKHIYRQWKKFAKDENDWRTGEETYGFGNVAGQLHYISDRYQCAFRMRWLYDMINKFER